jgi:uncharacterized membrane protein YccC
MSRPLASLPRLIWRELSEVSFAGPRGRLSLAAALAVGVATYLALLLHLQSVFWAGISAFVCMQANHPQSLRKGILRLVGTFTGAALALLLFPLVAFDPAATLALLFCAGTIAILGSFVSTYSYAWLLGGLTMLIIILSALDDPAQTFTLAYNRCSEIILGTSVSLAMARLFLPTESGALAPAPGWASLLGARSYMLGHAMRTGLAVALVPVVWRFFELPDLAQMAISISAVMAVPVLTGDADEDRRTVNDRIVQRLLGCTLGGGLGLLALYTPLTASFWSWLLLLMLGAAVGVQIETGRHGIPAVGMQAAIALIVTLVQGWGPALSPAPAFDRFAGMLGAITLLLIINYLFAPRSNAHAC